MSRNPYRERPSLQQRVFLRYFTTFGEWLDHGWIVSKVEKDGTMRLNITLTHPSKQLEHTFTCDDLYSLIRQFNAVKRPEVST